MRKKCKRKYYALINPITHAMEGAAISSRDLLDQLLRREWMAVDNFATGAATLDDWNTLCSMNNIAETLAASGVGPEAMETCRAVESALIEAAERFQRIGRMGLTGPGLQAMRDCVEYHDLQRASIPRSQYEKAIALTSARVKSGHVTVDLWSELGEPNKAVPA